MALANTIAISDVVFCVTEQVPPAIRTAASVPALVFGMVGETYKIVEEGTVTPPFPHEIVSAYSADVLVPVGVLKYPPYALVIEPVPKLTVPESTYIP